jgi:hypothetical protein
MNKRELLVQFDPDATHRILIGAQETGSPMLDLMILLEAVGCLATVIRNQGSNEIEGKSLDTWIHNQLNKHMSEYNNSKTFSVVKSPN